MSSSYQPTDPNQTPQAYGQGSYGQTTPAVDPGQTLGIVSIVLAFLVPIGGIIAGYLARKQSREVGFPDNNMGKIGFILGIVFTVLGLIGIIIYIIAFAALAGSSMG